MPARIAVVTGANKGIGLETVRQLLARGWTVWLGSRDRNRGAEAVAGLAGEQHPGKVRLLEVDVTDDASVTAAAEALRETGVDVLVNNAGIADPPTAPHETTAAAVAAILEVNVLGVVRVTNALLPLLRHGRRPMVLNLSSGLGSFERMTDLANPAAAYPDLAYPVSKAAVNMATVQYAKDVPEVRFVAVGPGFTATDLNAFAGRQTPAEAAQRVLAALDDESLGSPAYVNTEGVGW